MSKLKLTCKNCGKDVYKMPSEIRSKNVFCDRKCWSKYQEQLRRTEKCDCCGKNSLNGKVILMANTKFVQSADIKMARKRSTFENGLVLFAILNTTETSTLVSIS